MANWDNLDLIDGIDYTEDGGGRSATARYYMRASNLGSEPLRGDSAVDMSADLASWTIDSVTLTAISSSNYIVRVSALPYVGIEKSYERSTLRTEFTISWRTEEFFFGDEIMGLKPLPANPSEVAELENVDYTTGFGNIRVPGFSPVQLDEAGLILTWDVVEAGGAEPKACPFTKIPNWSLHDQRIPHDIVEVQFYVRANQSSRYANFRGIVTSASGIPNRYRIPETATSGVWKAADNKRRTLRDNQGRDFYEITRTMVRVPDVTDNDDVALRWDQAKAGGLAYWIAS